jgi:two-component system, chemotaxis family, chemotaxis protein CheY
MVMSLSDLDVMVVDDDEFTRKTAAQILKKLKVGSVTEATNGMHALAELVAWYPNNLPNIVLSDISMEFMDGFDFVDKVRDHELPSIRSIPIVLITAHGDMDTVKKAMKRDIDGFLTKPLSIPRLKTRLVQLLEVLSSTDND